MDQYWHKHLTSIQGASHRKLLKRILNWVTYGKSYGRQKTKVSPDEDLESEVEMSISKYAIWLYKRN